MVNPIKILIDRDSVVKETIKQYYIMVEQDKKKFKTLMELYEGLIMAQTVIFCSSKSRVFWLAQKMKKRNFSVSYVHGGLIQKERETILDQFKKGESRVLISTDLSGRGIDIEDIRFVINFDFPPDKEQFIHRIGRSGRFGKSGVAISFVIEEEFWKIKDLEQYYSITIDEVPENLDDLIS